MSTLCRQAQADTPLLRTPDPTGGPSLSPAQREAAGATFRPSGPDIPRTPPRSNRGPRTARLTLAAGRAGGAGPQAAPSSPSAAGSRGRRAGSGHRILQLSAALSPGCRHRLEAAAPPSSSAASCPPRPGLAPPGGDAGAAFRRRAAVPAGVTTGPLSGRRAVAGRLGAGAAARRDAGVRRATGGAVRCGGCGGSGLWSPRSCAGTCSGLTLGLQ